MRGGRRSQFDTSDLSTEDLIEDKTVLVSITTANYIKRMDLDTYRKQRRGGHGITGMTTKEEDVVESVFAAGMKDYLLCFTNLGRVYWLKVYQIPESSRIAKGKPIVNLLNLKDEVVTTVIPIREFREGPVPAVCNKTRAGHQDPAERVREPAFDRDQRDPAEGQRQARRCYHDRQHQRSRAFDPVRHGLRFHEETVRVVGREGRPVLSACGCGAEDTIVAVTLVEKDHLLTISDVGFGKRTEFDDFRGHGRATMGVKNMLLERDAVVSSRVRSRIPMRSLS